MNPNLTRGYARCRRIALLAWQAYEDHQFSTHVAALTYTTVLSVVPLLALTLALGRGFGLEHYIEAQLRANLNVQEGVIEQLMSFANGYISRTQDNMIVGVSLLVLVFTLISLVNNIEEKFNALWGIKTSRSIFSFSLAYLGLVVFLIFAFVFLSGVWITVLRFLDYLPPYDLVEWSMPFIIFVAKSLASGGVFILMYKFIPLTRVRWCHTLFPGLLAGTLFTLLQQFYVQSQIFLSTYNAVYGSFALLPLLMMWLYLTWTIGLGGALLAHVLQESEYADGEAAQTLTHCEHDTMALLLLQKIVQRFLAGESSLRLEDLAQAVQLSPRLAAVELTRLEGIGVLCHLGEGQEAIYKLDTDIYRTSLSEVLKRLDGQGSTHTLTTLSPQMAELAQLRAAFQLDKNSDRLLKDL